MISYMLDQKIRRRFARVITRIESGLYYHGSRNLKRFELTTKENEDNSWNTFERDYKVLMQGLKKEYPDIECVAMPESSPGKGLIHVHGIMSTSHFIPQGKLSDMWNEIHSSPIVYIEKIKSMFHARRYITKHMYKDMANMESFGGKLIASSGWSRKNWSRANEKIRRYCNKWDITLDERVKLFRTWLKCGKVVIRKDNNYCILINEEGIIESTRSMLRERQLKRKQLCKISLPGR